MSNPFEDTFHSVHVWYNEAILAYFFSFIWWDLIKTYRWVFPRKINTAYCSRAPHTESNYKRSYWITEKVNLSYLYYFLDFCWIFNSHNIWPKRHKKLAYYFSLYLSHQNLFYISLQTLYSLWGKYWSN